MRALSLALTIAALLGGCVDRGEPWSDPWILTEGELYLEDAAFRREALLESLENRENIYARERIASYGLDTAGWDTLPAWNPRSVPVTREVADALFRGDAVDTDVAPLFDGTIPETMEGWVALGREVFFRYPLRADPYVAYAVRNPDLDVGVSRDASGAVLGALVFRDVDGETTVGLACALCHTDVRGTETFVGAARRGLNYGALRVRYHDDTGLPIDDDLRARMEAWGPGRADITADGTEDPVAIPDLYGLRHESSLTQAGTIRHVGPASLAIRQETQYIHANHQRTRPPRVLTFALTMFLYSLEAPAPLARDVAAERGATLFARHCASCHANAAYGGGLVDAEVVGTDPSLASGAARGTGVYRTSPLLGVRDAAPYFHDGTVPSLEALLSTDRFLDTYAEGARGPGAVPGHRFGTQLPLEERTDLAAFLRTL